MAVDVVDVPHTRTNDVAALIDHPGSPEPNHPVSGDTAHAGADAGHAGHRDPRMSAQRAASGGRRKKEK
jgi:hypothetical protein